MINIKSTPYSGIQSKDKSWHLIPKPVTSMLGRVFFPRFTPIEALAYIDPNNIEKSARFISQDKIEKFSKHLRDDQGRAIKPQEIDYYVPIKVTPLNNHWLLLKIESLLKKIFFFLQPKKTPIIAYRDMPSTIFYGAQENDKIRYSLDGQLVELTLKQEPHFHPDPVLKIITQFDEFLSYLHFCAEQNAIQQSPYLVQEKHSFSLTNNAKFYSPSIGAVDLTEEIVQKLARYRENSIQIILQVEKEENKQRLFSENAHMLAQNIAFYKSQGFQIEFPAESEESEQQLLALLPQESTEDPNSILFLESQFQIINDDNLRISEKGYEIKLILQKADVDVKDMNILIDQGFLFMCGKRNLLPVEQDNITISFSMLTLEISFYKLASNLGPINPESITLENRDDGSIYFTATGNLLDKITIPTY